MPDPTWSPSADERRPPPVLFVHVMKTGGTTLFRHLREHYAPEEIYPSRQLDIQTEAGSRVDPSVHLLHLSMPYLAALPDERRRRIRAYVGHFPYVAREILGGGLVTVTILRDPVERALSLLRQRKRGVPWAQDRSRSSRSESATLEEIYARPFVYEMLIHNHQTKVFSMQRSDQPETYMDVIDVDGARLALAKANLANVDVLGVTEQYDHFLEDVEHRFGWQVKRQARSNVTPVHHRYPVSDALRRQIAADNAIDIELYEYAKDLVAMRRSRRTSA